MMYHAYIKTNTLEQAKFTQRLDTDSCFSDLAVQTVKRRETLD